MKYFILAACLTLAGCGTQVTPKTLTPAEQKNYDTPTATQIAATTPAAATPVAHAVSHIVHYMEIAGLLCLLAAAGLIYEGLVIPGVKCALAGIVLPVSAIWFNYHYGLVIALALIAAAIGFVWCFYKEDPSDFEALEAKLKTLETNIVGKVENLVTKKPVVPPANPEAILKVLPSA